MRRQLAFFVLAGSCCLVRAQIAPDPPGHDYPRGSQAISLLREVWDVSSENIYPRELASRFDPGTLGDLQTVLASNEDIALADVLNPFLETLGVSHTRFYDRRHQTYYLLRSLFSTRDLDSPGLYTIGVQLDEHDPDIVRAVMEGSPAEAAGILRGDRITAVDGVPFESLLQWQRATETGLTVESDGVIGDVTLTPVFQGFHRALARATVASRQVFRCTDRRIGYLHLWSGTHSMFLETLRDAVADARRSNLDGFVLDLRDGYGGAWWEYLDSFYPDRSEYFTATTLNSQGANALRRADPQDNADPWTGPLAVLINGGTRSGKESLAFQFKKGNRATLFGGTTAGAFTGARGVFADRDAGYIFYLSVQESLLDGTAIEGVGVAPDVSVSERPGEDAPLLAAMSNLGC